MGTLRALFWDSPPFHRVTILIISCSVQSIIGEENRVVSKLAVS